MQNFRVIAIAVLLSTGFGMSAQAATDTPQQNKMTMCNQQAGAMKGDERKKFMSSCLKKTADTGAGASSQQNKMKHCNEAATGKKGDERKAFMSSCLKKSS